MTDVDLIIVGAGIAGLAVAAHLPDKPALEVLCLEARDRVGGRAHSVPIEDICVDLGCHWLHRIHDNPLHDLAKQLDLKLARGHAVFSSLEGKRVSDAIDEVYDNLLPQFDAPDVKPPSWSDNVETWLRSHLADTLDDHDKALFEDLLPLYSNAAGCSLDQSSLRQLLNESATFANPDTMLLSGYIRIVQKLLSLAQERCVFRLQRNTLVKTISHDVENERVKVQTADGKVLTAKRVVVTVPIGVLQAGDITFEPSLPLRKLSAIANIGNGRLGKIFLVYSKPWLKTDLRGVAFFTSQEPLPQIRCCQLEINQSDRVYAVALIISPQFVEAVEAFSDAKLAYWGHGTLCSSGLARAGVEIVPPKKGFATRWLADPLSRGAYSFAKAGQQGPLDFLELARPTWLGRLRFAGEATHHELFGYTHGAYESGVREAKAIAVEMACEADQ